MKHLNYRPEIDGLRAFAVLSVLIFHFKKDWLPGGFTGVDIFFVISGFLITSIIRKSISGDYFSFAEFYSRRIKRILPVFYVVTLVTLLVSFFFLTSWDFNNLVKSLKRSLEFGANDFFSTTDYFGAATSELPLLHYWSLSIEEKFYFIWPLILVIFSKYLSPRNSWILFGLGLVFSFSLGTYYLVQNNISLAYFSFFSRFGELLLGGLISFVEIPSIAKRKTLQNTLGIAGILLMFGSFIFIEETSFFPGFLALAPTLSAAFLLVSSSSSGHWLNGFLSNRFFVFFGKISYSLYLWHWSALAIIRYYLGTENLPESLFPPLVIVLIGLSFASFRWIETPTRRLKMSFKNAFVFLFLLPAVVLSLSADFLNSKLPQLIQLPKEVTTYHFTEGCSSKNPDICLRGDTTKAPKILVIGDSHAAHLNFFFDEIGKTENWSATIASSSSCLPYLDLDLDYLPPEFRESCNKVRSFWQKEIGKYSAVVIAASWREQYNHFKNMNNGTFQVANFESSLIKTIDFFENRKMDIFLVLQVPSLTTHPLRKFGVLIPSPKIIEKVPLQNTASDRLKEISKGHPKIRWIYLDEFFPAESTPGLIDNQLVYMDQHHLNKVGAQILGKKFNSTHPNFF